MTNYAEIYVKCVDLTENKLDNVDFQLSNQALHRAHALR